MRKSRLFALSMIAFLFAGLVAVVPAAAKGSADIYSPAFLRANLIPGKTTTEQVKAAFGAPTDTSKSVNADYVTEYWRYSEGQKKGMRGRFKEMSNGIISAQSILPESMKAKLQGANNVLFKARVAEDKAGETQEGMAMIAGKNGSAQGRRSFSMHFEDGVLVSYGD